MRQGLLRPNTSYASYSLSVHLSIGRRRCRVLVNSTSHAMLAQTRQLQAYMSARKPSFTCRGLRGPFHSPEIDDDDEADPGNEDDADKEDADGMAHRRQTAGVGAGGIAVAEEPVTDSLANLWHLVAALHEGGWAEADESKCIDRSVMSPCA